MAESFGDLDPLMDARAGDVPASQWQGFHKIEKILWVGNTTKGAAAIADRLVANTLRLQGLVQSVPLQTAQIANGAEEPARRGGGVQDHRRGGPVLPHRPVGLPGQRRRRQGRGPGGAPILSQGDPELLSEIQQRFTEVDQSLAPYRAGSGYVLYTKLTDADTKKLSESIDALAQPISEVAPAVLR